MSEIIQIPNNINLELSTLLFGQNPNFESGKFTLEDLKNFLDDYFSNNNSGGGSGSSSIHVGVIPPDENLTDGTKWIETDETGIFINEWNYVWLGNQYRWSGTLSVATIATLNTNTNLTLPEQYDVFVQSFTSYIRPTAITANSSSYSFGYNLYKNSLVNLTPATQLLASNVFENPSVNNKLTLTQVVNEVVSTNFTPFIPDSNSTMRLYVNNQLTNVSSANVSSMHSVCYALVRKELEE